MEQQRVWFGRHRGKLVSEVDTGWLGWSLRQDKVKLSAGLRAAVAAELQRRGVEVPPVPPYTVPPCRRCRGTEVRVTWQQTSDGTRRLRGTCGRCNGYLRFLPMTPEWIAQANVAADEATVAAHRGD